MPNLPNKASPKYRVSLSLPGLKPSSKTAPSIREALDALIIPQYFKGKGVITATLGKLKAEVWMYPVQLRKLFVNSTSKQLLEKRLLLTLK